MSRHLTHGFDIVLQADATAMTDLAQASAPLETLSLSTTVGTVPVSATFHFQDPEIGLNTPTVAGGLRVKLPFRNSSISIGPEGDGLPDLALRRTAFGLEGKIVIIDVPSVASPSAAERQVILDFTNGIPQATIDFETASEKTINRTFSMLGISMADVIGIAEPAIRGYLSGTLRQMALSSRVPVASGSTDPFTVSDLQVLAINVPGGSSGDALSYLVRTNSTGATDAAAFTESSIQAGDHSILLLSNDLVLRRLIAPALAKALDESTRTTAVTTAFFTAPCSLNRSVTLDSGFTMTRLKATVVGDHTIRLAGSGTMSGDGWNASLDFRTDLKVQLSEGRLTVRQDSSTTEVDVDLNLAWWVYVIALLPMFVVPGLGQISGVVTVEAVRLGANVVLDALLPVLMDTIASSANSSAVLPIAGSGFLIDDLILESAD